MLARIRTNSPSEVSHIADALRKRGYEIEIVPAEFEAQSAAELEIAAECFSAHEALAQARQISDELGCDLLIAPGALDSLRIVQLEAERQLRSIETQQAPSVASPAAVTPAPQSQVAIEQVAQAVEEKGPDWMQLVLDRCAVALAKLQGVAEEIPGVARHAVSRGWAVCRRASVWAAGKTRIGATKLGGASRGAAVTAGARWSEARQQYVRVRAAATAKAAKMREERRQAKAAARNPVAVEVLGTTAPLPQTSPRGWRAALAGAAMAALVIGVGFSVGAGRTPAATPNLTSATTTSALPATTRVSPPVRAVKPQATKASSTVVRSKRRYPAETNDTEQEVIVRHFAPVKSTPAVSADGVHHYSDTDQR